MDQATLHWIENNPNDPNVQQMKAKSEMEIRELLGQRPHDA